MATPAAEETAEDRRQQDGDGEKISPALTIEAREKTIASEGSTGVTEDPVVSQ